MTTSVRHTTGWCALKRGTRLDPDAISDATECGQFVTMRVGSDEREPDCSDCRAVLGLLPTACRTALVCAGHITDDERLPYLAWYEKAKKFRLEKQVRCSECHRFFFSWERRT